MTDRIAVVGDSCIDTYAGGAAAIGGNALNVAVNLALHHYAAEYIGVVGDDAHGRRIRAALRGAGVIADRIHVRHGPSWVACIGMRDGGTAVLESEDPGISGPYAPTHDELEYVGGLRHVHLANLADPAAVMTALAGKAASTSYDFGIGEATQRAVPVDVVFFSRDGSRAPSAAVATARNAVRRGARVAVVTMGRQGSLATDGDRVYRMAAERLDAVDTLGAGDAFIASFIARRLEGGSIEGAMEAGTRAASLVCLHWAAWPQPATEPIIEVATG